MNLLIDIGNTNLKWAVHEPGALGEMLTVRHHGGLPIDLHAAWEDLPPPEQVLVSNVGSDVVSTAVEHACRAHWDCVPRFVRTEPLCHGVRIAYEHPERLGVDRWLGLLAARHASPGPVLVVDAGTAVTFDLLLKNGRHLGGLILPGVQMMRDSLLADTQIPRVAPEEPGEPWAADTATAIGAGSIQAPAALAERLYHRLAEHANGAPEIILTGGDAERLLPAIGLPVRHHPDLILQGLSLLD
ncbi:MAG: type III pantothenate kinase [Pseudomonadota bacterium]|nr:type III pantothenate kinase [Pseudomonadota bacterium]